MVNSKWISSINVLYSFADKERVAAAMENAQILDVINKGIRASDYLD